MILSTYQQDDGSWSWAIEEGRKFKLEAKPGWNSPCEAAEGAKNMLGSSYGSMAQRLVDHFNQKPNP